MVVGSKEGLKKYECLQAGWMMDEQHLHDAAGHYVRPHQIICFPLLFQFNMIVVGVC